MDKAQWTIVNGSADNNSGLVVVKTATLRMELNFLCNRKTQHGGGMVRLARGNAGDDTLLADATTCWRLPTPIHSTRGFSEPPIVLVVHGHGVTGTATAPFLAAFAGRPTRPSLPTTWDLHAAAFHGSILYPRYNF